MTLLGIDNIFNKNNLVESFRKASSRNRFPTDDLEEIKTFTSDLSGQLDNLFYEIKHGIYEPLPARQIQQNKDIVLLPFRDRIVHECLQMELKKIICSSASKGNFGYLEGKSTYQAADYIHTAVSYSEVSCFLVTDIENFFQSISHSILLEKLSGIMNPSVIELCKKLLSGPIIIDNELLYPKQGIILGSPLSPTLSNLYLHQSDLELETRYPLFVRYSDDLLLGKSTPFEKNDLDEVTELFHALHLELNQEKTHYYSKNDQFLFLGFEFTFLPDHNPAFEEDKNLHSGTTHKEKIHYLQDKMKKEQTIESALQYLQYFAQHQSNTDFDPDFGACHSVIGENSQYLFALLSEILQGDNTDLEDFPYDKVISQCLLDEKWGLAYILQNTRMKQLPSENTIGTGVTKPILPKNYLDLFSGQKNSFAKGYADSHGIRHYYRINMPLSSIELQKMIDERQSLGIYPVIQENQSCIFILDLDIEKRFILDHGEKEDLMAMMLKKVKTFAFNIKNLLDDAGIHSYVLYSGYKGYHLWIFFDKSLAIDEAWNHLNKYIHSVFIPDNIMLERIPSLEADKEEVIKLPLAWHELSHHQSVFLNQTGEVEKDQVSFIEGIKKNNAIYFCEKDPPVIDLRKSDDTVFEKKEDVPVSEVVNAVLNQCSLIGCMVNKLKEYGYLTHYERNAILYVFGRLGNDGREYIHRLMALCINYQYEVTEGFISRMKDKPVSCQKLGLRFPQYASSCACEFADFPSFYPSPVIHAYRIDPQNVTRPDYIDREARDKELKAITEKQKINIMAEKLLSLSKTKKEAEKELELCTKSIHDIFNTLGVTELDTPVGRLMQKDDCWYIKVT